VPAAATMTWPGPPCRHDVVDVIFVLLLLSTLLGVGRPSPLDYCHRLDDHPPRMYATKTAYDEVRARDLEPRRLIVLGADDDNSAASSTSDASTPAKPFTFTDDHSCQRQYISCYFLFSDAMLAR